MPVYPIVGMPGAQTAVRSAFRRVFEGPGVYLSIPGGVIVDGTKSRDPDNSPDINVLQGGLLLGMESTSPYNWATSVFGVVSAATAGTAPTSITVTAAQALEITRRIGTTGNITVTSPTAANTVGSVRQMNVAFTAVNTTTGVVTITSPGVNAVQTISFPGTPTGGTFTLSFVDYLGQVQETPLITFAGSSNANYNTTSNSINTAINTALAASAAVAASVTNTGFTITFSGTNYSGLPQPLVIVNSSGLTGGNTQTTVNTTTAGVNGTIIAGAFVGDTDGSQTPLSFIGDGSGFVVTDEFGASVAQVQCGVLAIAGTLATGGSAPNAGIVNYPTDTGMKDWLRKSLSTLPGAKFIFMDIYNK